MLTIILLSIQTITLIGIIYLGISIYRINKRLAQVYEELNTQKGDIVKTALWQSEQYNLNQLIIKKFQEIDEINLLKHIDYLKSVNKIGEC